MKKHRKTSRGFHNHIYSIQFLYRLFRPVLGITLLSMLPAFLYGCERAAENFSGSPPAASVTKISLPMATAEISTLDVFVFCADRMQRLDCYQRFEDMDDWNGTVISGSGARIITAIANSPYGREYWFPVNSLSYLTGSVFYLEDETRDCPVMSGELSTDQGSTSTAEDLHLLPLASEVRLNSISCDFTGRAYAGEKLSGAKVYLTNVNAEGKISDDGDSPPMRIINSGKLEEDDVMNFRDPSLIMTEIQEEIGTRAIYPGIRLRCHRSNHPEETPGTPYTRLVIEGKISGKTYYWPINVNRDGGEEQGIWRGKCYSYDVRITRKGSTDPDTPVGITDIIISQEISEWKEIEEYTVGF